MKHMKQLTSIMILIVFFASLSNQQDCFAQLSRQKMIQSYNKLKQGGISFAKTKSTSKGIGREGKFEIAPVTLPNGQECELGIKVWFELKASGKFVDPTLHKWQRKEQFYVHVQAPVPLYVSLMQNYPDDRPKSRTVVPDRKFPDTFKPLVPGQSTRLPVLLQMDNDLRDEIMSMVVARADCDVDILPINSALGGETNNSDGISGPGGVMKAAFKKQQQKFVEINDSANATRKYKGQSTKFIISAASGTPISESPDEVAFFMLGPGRLGQWQLTLHKD